MGQAPISPETVDIPARSVSSTPVEVTDFVDNEVTVTLMSGSFSADVSEENRRRFSVVVGDPPPFVIVKLPTITLVGGPDSVLEGDSALYTVLVEDFWEGMNLWVHYSLGPDGDPSTNDAEFDDRPDPHEASDFTGNVGHIVVGESEDTSDGEGIYGTFPVETKNDDAIDDSAREYFVVTLEPGPGYRLGPVVPWTTRINEGICDRTEAVQRAVLNADELSDRELGGDCSDVTDEDLVSLTTSFALNHRMIENLKARDLIGMDNLQSLRLDGNSLTDLPDGLFSAQALLSELNLKDNQLTRVGPSKWTGLNALRELVLSNNALGNGTLPADAFHGLGTLETLRLDGNSLTQTDLPDSLFSHQSSLAVLDLRRNELTEVRSGMWEGPNDLQELLLSYNKLGDGALSEDDFDGLGTLETLFLDSNKIWRLPDNVFGHLDELSHLNLGYNLLSDVPSGTFSEITDLMRLDLSGNSISSVEEGAFATLSLLDQLDLQFNDAYRLSPGMFSGLSNLSTVNLYGNWTHTFNVVAELEQVDEGIRVNVAEAVPLEMTVTLSAYGGVLSHDVVTVAAGQGQSEVFTVVKSKADVPATITVESVTWDGSTLGMVPVPGDPLTVNP